MRLALVHDWLKDISGAERVLFQLHELYPEAPIYVLFYDKKFVRSFLPGADIRASFLQRIPFVAHLYPALSWLMPMAIESFDISGYDRVLSSSAIFSKGLVLRPGTKHICYCYSPTRFLWDRKDDYSRFGDYPWLKRIFQHVLRLWDYNAASRVDQFVAISKTVQARIKKYYRRDSMVIYPPMTSFDGARQDKSVMSKDFYLIVSRLYEHKKVEIAVQAFNKLGYPLFIIGEGPEKKRLEKMASKNIIFLGRQDDEVVAEYYRSATAFIMPQEEDFGLTPLEAMSFGTPVIALRKGGATETVIEGMTGEFFDDPIPEGLADAVRRFRDGHYDPEKIKARAKEFSSQNFKKEIAAALQ
ncbi:MAG TPA: glycosyltransferase [Candidatus Paceibacterota bacterium]|nr:glycosyltransferase [Candidatus Paceibacterota bacterium]